MSENFRFPARWVVADPSFRFPFGFQERFVRDGTGEVEGNGVRQAPLEENQSGDD